MTNASLANDPRSAQPELLKDPSFWGLNFTQFFGAFNDNLFKQLVMLLCLDYTRRTGGWDLQSVAMILFSAPFILISGYAGYLSDRYSKRTVVILCKAAEVLITLFGMIGFYSNNLTILLTVLCLMGVHSAFFGPAKYGILPEILRDTDLPRANGSILMATFLAIIFGLSAAGWSKQNFAGTLWLASVPCFLIAITGLCTSLLIRKTPRALPNLQWSASSLFIGPDARQMLKIRRDILGVLIMSSVFWFVGGVIYPPAINAFAKGQLRFSDTGTGILAASTGVGIAIGCMVAGILSKDRVRAWIVRTGAWGLTISLLILAVPGPGWTTVRDEMRNRLTANEKVDLKAATEAEGSSQAAALPATAETPPFPYSRGTLLGTAGSAFGLIAVGFFAGFYSVPLQVYLQMNAPVGLKGQVIATMNLFNWIGIFTSALIYFGGQLVLVKTMMLPEASMFGFAGLLMLPVALFYRPPEMRPPNLTGSGQLGSQPIEAQPA